MLDLGFLSLGGQRYKTLDACQYTIETQITHLFACVGVTQRPITLHFGHVLRVLPITRQPRRWRQTDTSCAFFACAFHRLISLQARHAIALPLTPVSPCLPSAVVEEKSKPVLSGDALCSENSKKRAKVLRPGFEPGTFRV